MTVGPRIGGVAARARASDTSLRVARRKNRAGGAAGGATICRRQERCAVVGRPSMVAPE